MAMTVARCLSKDEFLACFADPMRDVTAIAEQVLDIWPYVDSVVLPMGEVTEVHDVAYVYRDGRGRFDQVLVGTDASEVFLVVVIDLETRAIHGHRWLDLQAEYGTSGT
ncbi:hypothetical protein ASF53_10605 [Methylobacterium sp. Leaf123]|uniref:hypothetical protein n=1 Tax=Methylobacterium sp. Leaf123 TaxID=1736264 RepID=UPI0006FEA24E|nr:hypothetical protein [Methylobacterium sp. Leaf123]KQQ14260.1 hypothetical protein ASF53_10605 [Methylobacterium sp. Leaf123]